MTPRMVVPPVTPGLKGSFPTKRAAKDFCGTGGRVVEPKAGPIPRRAHGSSPSLLCTWAMLSAGPAGSRVTVNGTLPEGTGSLPSQGRGHCILSASQNTHPTSGKLPAAIGLQFQPGFFCNVSES